MMQQNQALFESLFKRNIGDLANKNLLEEITAAHPYFSPAQFYLLQHTPVGTDSFDRQATKTNILFNNPLWLNFQWQRTKPGITVQEEKIPEPIYGSQDTEAVYEPGLPDEHILVKEALPAAEPEPIKEELQINEYTGELVKEEQPVIEQVSEPEIKFEPRTITDLPVKEEAPVHNSTIEPEAVTEPDLVKQEFAAEEMHGEPEANEDIEIEPMKIELKLPEEKGAGVELPLFEPMHMVDYFASQGIKLSEEVQSGDKLGKQLKSFTEWLKTMKKVHAVSPAEETVQADKSVEAMAELSNRENEVITEAMAEVFARQGKLAKATEVYQKLSLLNPAKSAYFAAKIDNLKGA